MKKGISIDQYMIGLDYIDIGLMILFEYKTSEETLKKMFGYQKKS